MDTFNCTFGLAKKLHYFEKIFFKAPDYSKSIDYNLGVPYGRAIRCNLFIFKEKIKRISTAIPNPVYGKQNVFGFSSTLNQNKYYFRSNSISVLNTDGVAIV